MIASDRAYASLTDEQNEALLAAFEGGYYDIPRDLMMEELATELGISHQALSERFRRAHRTLVEAELVTRDDDPTERTLDT